jgi:hypothetical protein
MSGKLLENWHESMEKRVRIFGIGRYEQLRTTSHAGDAKAQRKMRIFSLRLQRLRREIFADAVGYLTSCDPLMLSLA